MILVGTDFHIGMRNSDETFMRKQLDYLDILLDQMKQRNIKTFLHLGDLFDNRKLMNIRTQSIFMDRFFGPLHDAGIELITLIGNHDIYYRNTNAVHSIALLAKQYDNIRIIEEPTELELASKQFMLLPWICKENYDTCIDAIKRCKADILCGHLEVNGALMTKGIYCEHGLSPSLFKHIPEVWSGHFHIPSMTANIEYIGNPFDMTWADYNTPKGCFFFDGTERIRVENPYRMFALMQYDDTTTIDAKSHQDQIVRVECELGSIKDQAKLNQALTDLQAHAYKVELIDTTQHIASISIEDQAAELQDTRSRISSIIDAMELDDSLQKDEIKARILSLYDIALEQQSA